MDKLALGLRHVRTLEVTPDLTAVAVGSGDVPVLATPAVLSLAEGACVDAIADNLEVGQTSVGTYAEVRHDEATPVGRAVRVTAELVGRDGRRLEFEVVVREGDQGGRVAARVAHHRVVVDRQRFLEQVGATEG